MKTLKKILVLMLALAMVLSFAACGKDGDDTNNPTATPRPTAKTYTVDITVAQLNNYYVAYKLEKGTTDMELDENGNYVEKTEAKDYIEVGYENQVLVSSDGGVNFSVAAQPCFNSTADIGSSPMSVFNVHLNYEDGQLEKKGTETVAGRECTIYSFKNGPMEINMYVDETFGSTGICLKYVAKGPLAPQTIEVTELKFGAIDSEPGYEFTTFMSKVPTPEPTEEAAA